MSASPRCRFCAECGKGLVRLTGVPDAQCGICQRVLDDEAMISNHGSFHCVDHTRTEKQHVRHGAHVRDVKIGCNFTACTDCYHGPIGALPAREVSRVIRFSAPSMQVALAGEGAAAAEVPTGTGCPRCASTHGESTSFPCPDHQSMLGSVDTSNHCRWVTSTSYRCERCHDEGKPDRDLSTIGTRQLHECDKCKRRFYRCFIGTPRAPRAALAPHTAHRRARSPEVKEEATG